MCFSKRWKFLKLTIPIKSQGETFIKLKLTLISFIHYFPPKFLRQWKTLQGIDNENWIPNMDWHWNCETFPTMSSKTIFNYLIILAESGPPILFLLLFHSSWRTAHLIPLENGLCRCEDINLDDKSYVLTDILQPLKNHPKYMAVSVDNLLRWRDRERDAWLINFGVKLIVTIERIRCIRVYCLRCYLVFNWIYLFTQIA